MYGTHSGVDGETKVQDLLSVCEGQCFIQRKAPKQQQFATLPWQISSLQHATRLSLLRVSHSSVSLSLTPKLLPFSPSSSSPSPSANKNSFFLIQLKCPLSADEEQMREREKKRKRKQNQNQEKKTTQNEDLESSKETRISYGNSTQFKTNNNNNNIKERKKDE